MTEARQVWLTPEHIGGQDPQVGQWYSLTQPCSAFALRKWDGSTPFAVGEVVSVVELRPYGEALAQEVVFEKSDAVQAACELASEGLFEVREAPAPAHGPIDVNTLHGVGPGNATVCGIVGGSHKHPALRITYNPDLVNCPVCNPPGEIPGTDYDPLCPLCRRGGCESC